MPLVLWKTTWCVKGYINADRTLEVFVLNWCNPSWTFRPRTCRRMHRLETPVTTRIRTQIYYTAFGRLLQMIGKLLDPQEHLHTPRTAHIDFGRWRDRHDPATIHWVPHSPGYYLIWDWPTRKTNAMPFGGFWLDTFIGLNGLRLGTSTHTRGPWRQALEASVRWASRFIRARVRYWRCRIPRRTHVHLVVHRNQRHPIVVAVLYTMANHHRISRFSPIGSWTFPSSHLR